MFNNSSERHEHQCARRRWRHERLRHRSTRDHMHGQLADHFPRELLHQDLSPRALLLRQCVVLLLLEQTVQFTTELVVILCSEVRLHGLLPGFAESLERHLAKRVEVVRELDSRRELRCIEPRIGKEHELARRPCRHGSNDRVSQDLHNALEARAQVADRRLDPEAPPPVRCAMRALRRKRVGRGRGGHEGVSVHLPWRSCSACGSQCEPAFDDVQTGLLPLVPALLVFAPFPCRWSLVRLLR